MSEYRYALTLVAVFVNVFFSDGVYMHDDNFTSDKTRGAGGKAADAKTCDYCGEYHGVVVRPDYILGEYPLEPCPKCVTPFCKCGGISPYYYFENDKTKDCHCRETRIRIERIMNVYNHSGIEKKYKWRLLGEFKAKNQDGNKAKLEALKIVKQFPNVKKGLFLWGNPGTGKTLLSTMILTELIFRQGVQGKFVKISRNFFGRLRETFNPASPNYGRGDEMERELHSVDVLVLDDVGVQKDSPWEQETLYNLIDARYESEKFTVFTSNNDPRKALTGLSQGRILSRLKEMCVIMEISGNDMRETL